MRVRLLAALLSLAAPLAMADSRVGLVSFRRIAIPDDVPAHLCTALAQDASGFLWIGTQGGLVRYDGFRFRTPVASGYVRALLVARDGRVWAGFFSGGLAVVDPKTGAVTRYPGSRVEGLAEDRSGAIWVATNTGLDRLDPRTGRVEHVTRDLARALLVDRAGNLWFGTRGGLFRRTPRGELAQVAMAGELVSRLYEDRDGRIWIGTTEHGAAVLDPRSGALHRFVPGPDRLSHFWVYGFAEGAENEMWIATFGGGINVVDMRTLAIVDRLRHDAADESTLPADRVGAILRDRAGVLWAGTWGDGIARHDPAARAFRALRFSPSNPGGLTHPSVVRALELRDGRILAGTNGNGIDVFDQGLLRLDHIAVGDGSITCLAQAENGDVWIATLDGALHRMRGTAFEHVTPKDGLAGGPIRTIAFRNGEVWAGSAFGLARVDAATLRAAKFTEDAGQLGGMAVEAIAPGPDGRLWLGTDGGLELFDPAAGRSVRVEGPLPDKWVPDLAVDRRGRLWVGTHGGAAILTGFDGKRATFEIVAQKLGRPALPAEELIEDAEGKMWIGPRLRVDPERWTAQEFGPADGCAFLNVFIASRARTCDGRLLFGSPQGFLVVDPAAIRPWTYAPPVVATSFSMTDHGFRLEFAALDYTAPERTHYRYQLIGHDSAWTTVDATQRSLVYAGLAPGDYTLRVAATNRAGLWSPHELRVPVAVAPAFFETWPFRIVAAAAVAALAYAVYRLRIRTLRARSAALERTVDERTCELRAAYARIEEASLTDALTGLRNRRYLDQTMASDLALAARSGSDLIFLLLDLDHFKSVNDVYGHAAGDAVLVQLAQVLRATFRTSDVVARWGGEEFVVVVRFLDRREAPALAEKLRAAVESHRFLLPDGMVLEKTCSIGGACWPFSPAVPDAVGWEEILGVADACLYLAKRGGRNRWMVGELPPNHIAPAAAAARFREDAATAIDQGVVLVSVPPLPQLSADRAASPS